MNGRKQEVIGLIMESGCLEIRNVDSGEEPFLYSSRNHGPIYINIKGLVGFDAVFEPMVQFLADRIIEDKVEVDLIVGMITGGAIPAYRLKQILSQRLDKNIIYIYQRGSRKIGGHKELDTGDRNNPHIPAECHTLVVEELVNFGVTTCNGVLYERSKGRIANDAATILFYENHYAIKRLEQNNISLHWCFTLSELLNFVLRKKCYEEEAVFSCLNFLEDPKKWNLERGYSFHE